MSIQQRQPQGQLVPSLWYKQQGVSSHLLCSENKVDSSKMTVFGLQISLLAFNGLSLTNWLLSEDKSALHRSLLILVTKGRNVLCGEEVSVHIINACEVVNVSSVVEQIARLIREEVSINNRRQKQIFHTGI